MFRTPQTAPSQPSSLAQSLPVSMPVSQPLTASTQSTNFACQLNGKPWVLAPTQKLQGLLLERPAITKDTPPTKIITISLQSTDNERLLIEIVADKPSLEAAKITLTTKKNVAKANVTLKEVTKEEAPESFNLSFTFDAKLQPLGGAPDIPLEGCSLQDVIIRSLKTEAPIPEE